MDLEGIHLDGTDVVHVGEDEDVGIVGGVGHGAVVVVPPLRIVVRHRADECELDARVALLDRAVRVDDAERVLPGIESRDLGEERTGDVDAELVDDVLRILGGERHVLRRQRIDRRWPDERLGQSYGVGHVFAEVEDRRVVAADRRQEDVEDLLVRR